jgi:eukaryotic-like serine/threonine-protein kinase
MRSSPRGPDPYRGGWPRSREIKLRLFTGSPLASDGTLSKLCWVKHLASAQDQIGPYRLLSSLGRGGMAEVWKAEHRHLGQVRALKILLPEVAERPEVVSRLVTEARATARLRHPAIVEVFDCDVLDSGRAFIAMEYLRGEHLRAWLDRIGKLAEHSRLAAAMLGTVAEGLAFAHGLGVVHRDLKPENVFLVPLDGDEPGFAIKILDFGIAKLLREEGPSKTRPGCVVGTPTYMAPEQWQPGDPIDHRTDIYALGCLFYELLSGRPPFPYYDDMSIMGAHLTQRPADMRMLEPAVPPVLEQLLAQMLAKLPQDRQQTMEQVIVALESFLGLDRARFKDLLRAPGGFLVSLGDETGRELPANDPTRLADAPRPSPSAGSAPISFAAHADTAASARAIRRAQPYPRAGVFISVAVLVLSVLALATVLSKRDGIRAAGPAAPASTSAGALVVAAAPVPPSPSPAPAPAPASFTIRLSSSPAGAQAWVEGESSPRGQTPLDLVFATPGPKPVLLVAAGFRPEALTIVAGGQEVANAVLAPGPPAAARRTSPRRRASKPAPSPSNHYQAVGD